MNRDQIIRKIARLLEERLNTKFIWNDQEILGFAADILDLIEDDLPGNLGPGIIDIFGSED